MRRSSSSSDRVGNLLPRNPIPHSSNLPAAWSVLSILWSIGHLFADYHHFVRTTMLHWNEDPFDAALQLSPLRWVTSSVAGATGLAENYAGLRIGYEYAGRRA
jgi:hypothetical protein